jgi:hypothetical protein
VSILSVGRRFRGFESGALGGYVAGVVVAGRIDGPAEVNLRSLPPMGRDLELSEQGDDAGLVLRDGDTLVLEATPAPFELEIPPPPGLAEAEEAAHRLIHEELGHLYPSCFTCGPDREPGDGLRLFMGRTSANPDLLASAWTPDPSLAESGDAIPTEMVWAALDCPSIWAVGEIPEGGFNVLARQRVELLAPVPVGTPAIVTAWPIEHDGRKHLTGVAIHDDDGRQLARGESLLVEVPSARLEREARGRRGSN